MADTLALKGDRQEPLKREKKPNRTCRFLKYFVIKWTLQLFCAVLVVAVVLWLAIQFMRIFNVLGVSQEPPGLTYLIDWPAPPPPPRGLNVNDFAAG